MGRLIDLLVNLTRGAFFAAMVGAMCALHVGGLIVVGAPLGLIVGGILASVAMMVYGFVLGYRDDLPAPGGLQ